MTIIAGLFATGLLIYFVTLLLAFIVNLSALSEFKALILSNLAFNVGLPTSAVGAFGVVSVFWSAFPQTGEKGEPLTLNFLNLQFTGPSGPITLWVVCFLALVFAMYLLREKREKN